MSFEENYRKWLDDCLDEFNERYRPRKYHQETVPDDNDPGSFVEFSEDGNAYPHGLGGTNFIPNAVTPWEDSLHYTDWRN